MTTKTVGTAFGNGSTRSKSKGCNNVTTTVSDDLGRWLMEECTFERKNVSAIVRRAILLERSRVDSLKAQGAVASMLDDDLDLV